MVLALHAIMPHAKGKMLDGTLDMYYGQRITIFTATKYFRSGYFFVPVGRIGMQGIHLDTQYNPYR